MKLLLYFNYCLAVFLICTAITAFGAGDEVKLVSVGSHLPSLAELKENIAHYEAQAPFDGVMMHVGFSDVFNPKGFSDSDENDAKNKGKIYKDIKFSRWQYNFLGVLIDQHKPDWFNEKEWKKIADNWGKAARLAKRIGMVGICFDPEGYAVYPVQSYWKASWWVQGGGKLSDGKVQPPDRLHTEKQYLEIARARGRQVGEAVFKEFPEIVLWAFYWWSFNGADMMGEFCNGILEVMPPKAKFVDGDEWVSYCAKGEADYDRIRERNKSGCGMLDKKLSAKHKAQGGVAPAFYLDAYARPEESGCLTPAIGKAKSKVHFFKDNLKEAKKKATGGHIWIYGEQNTWFSPPDGNAAKYETWEKALPGISEVLFGDRLKEVTGNKKGRRK